MNDLSLGWALMGYGLAGVFTTLLMFIIMIRLIVRLFPDKKIDKDENGYNYNQ